MLALVLAFVVRRTSWRRVSPLPVVAPRRAGEPAAAIQVLDEALAAAAGDAAGEVHILVTLGRAHLGAGNLRQATTLLHRARDRSRAIHDAFAEARALATLGTVALAERQPRRAVAELEKAVELFRSVHSSIDTVEGLVTLGGAHEAAGDGDAAQRSWGEARQLAETMDPRIAEHLLGGAAR